MLFTILHAALRLRNIKNKVTILLLVAIIGWSDFHTIIHALKPSGYFLL